MSEHPHPKRPSRPTACARRDLIPDFIPVLGILDDLVLLPAMIWVAIKIIPCHVMVDARARAEQEPLRLARNWCMAVFIFLM